MTVKSGHTIELYFEDDVEYNSLLRVKMSNWDGWAYRIARGDVKLLKNSLNQKKINDQIAYLDDGKNYNGFGVYLLFFDDDGDDAVYVGESEQVLERLDQHIMDFKRGKTNEYDWEYAIAFMSPSLHKTHIKYIENQLDSIIKENKQIKCVTRNTSSRKPNKSIMSTALRFIEDIKMIMPYLNPVVFKHLQSNNIDCSSNDVFYIKTETINAEGYISKNGFTVKAGAQVAGTTQPSLSNGYKKLYYSLISENIINNKNKLTIDYEFSSASAAASILYGSNQNGKGVWKNADNLTLKEYLKKSAKAEDNNK